MRGALPVVALTLAACSASGGALGEPGGAAGAAASGGAPAGWEEASISGGSGGQAGGVSGAGGQSGAAGASDDGGALPVGPGSNGPSITCPGVACQAPLQHCCITGEGSGNPPAFQCIPLEIGCGLNALERMCDAGEDCGEGQLCCADTTFGSTPSKCRAECLSGEQRTCWTGSECGSTAAFCCFFPSRPAGFCKESPHPGATLCVK